MNDYKLEIHKYIARIGKELIGNIDKSYIKKYFKTPEGINLQLNRTYQNCDLTKLDEYFYQWTGRYWLKGTLPAFLRYKDYSVDREEHSSMKLLEIQNNNLILLSFNLDEKNVIEFHIFETELSNYTDKTSDWYNFYGINAMKLNGNSITFTEFNNHFNQFKDVFKNKLSDLVESINQTKEDEKEFIKQQENSKINSREAELRGFIN